MGDDEVVSCAWKSKGTIATITPVSPPSTKVTTPPKTKRIATVLARRAPNSVAMKQKICTDVGIATAVDAAEKIPSEMPGRPVVNMWCTHSPKLRKPVPIAASTIHE
jgi:hypothetical protein